MIARVFPRKTAASPNDELAFFGVPTIDAIATCIRRGVTAVNISVTFTYDLDKADELYDAWQIIGVPVEVGGPAFDDRMGDCVRQAVRTVPPGHGGRVRRGVWRLGSLFDGVGGFPLIWSQLNGVGSVKWASEIEEFPIAVTKRHCEEGLI